MLPLATLVACGDDAEQLVGYQIDPAPPVGHLTTADGSQNDAPFPLRTQPDGLLIAFIGSTNCPDACPTAMAEVRIALERLGEDAAPIDDAAPRSRRNGRSRWPTRVLERPSPSSPSDLVRASPRPESGGGGGIDR